MFTGKKTEAILAIVVALVLLVAMAALGGCDSKDGATSDPTTALGSLSVAESALSTSAPDARLLVIQTVNSVAPTQTPVWAYLFGSPATDMLYLVYTSEGKVMTTMEYGEAGFSADQWAEIPDPDSVKIDSDEAYDKALAASGATGTPAGYFMGLMTYKTAEDTSTVVPMKWNVYFDPGTSGAASDLILVDADSGDAAISAE